MRRRTAAMVALVVLPNSLLLGCAAGDKGTGPGAKPEVKYTLVITPTGAVLKPAGTTRPRATILQDGANAGPCLDCQWTVTDPAIASLSTTRGEDPTITAKAEGETTVTANVTWSGSKLNSTFDLRVEKATPIATTLLVLPSSVSLKQAGTQQLSCAVLDQSGNGIPAHPVDWSTSAAGIATVSAAGVVTGVSDGNATVTCTARGTTVSKGVPVTVSTPVATLTLSPGTLTMENFATRTAKATARNADGSPMVIQSGTFATTDLAVARIADVSGAALDTYVVEAGRAGTARVTLTVRGTTGESASASIDVTVTSAPFTISASPSSLQLKPKETGTMTCISRGTLSNEVLAAALVWTSSNEAVATTFTKSTQIGQVVGVADGTTTVTCGLPGRPEFASIPVTVTTPPVTIVVDPNPIVVNVGQIITLGTTVKDFEGKPVNNPVLTFSTSNVGTTNTGVVTVTPTGIVQGVTAGTTTVRVSTAGIGASTLVVPVTVVAPACGGMGSFTMTSELISDPGGFSRSILLSPTLNMTLALTATPGNFSVAATPGTWVTTIGPLPNAAANCSFSIDNFGTVANRLMKAVLTGNYPATGPLSWTLSFFAVDGVTLNTSYRLTKN